MTRPEFSHRVPLEKLASRAQDYVLQADETERAALARRFDLLGIDRLEAQASVMKEGPGAGMTGRFHADVTQRCVVSGEPVQAHVDEALALRFEPLDPTRAEVELEEGALDVQPVEDGMIDIGEAVAQSLLLALDPYPRAPDAVLAQARALLLSEEAAAAAEAAGRAEASPFAKLKPS